MSTCKLCGKSGLFIKVNDLGICKECAPSFSIDLLNTTNEFNNTLKKIDAELPYLDTVELYNKVFTLCEKMMEWENKKIPVLKQSPAKTYSQLKEAYVENIKRITKVGELEYYGLKGWWVSTFTKEEQDHMVQRYQPLGGQRNALLEGNITWSSGDKVNFLNSLMGWFRSPADKSIFLRILNKLHEYTRPDNSPDELPAHYTAYLEDIKQLKREGKYQEAKELLLKCISKIGVDQDEKQPPWYFNELAIVCRKLNQTEEAAQYDEKAVDIIIKNYRIQEKLIAEMPKDIREKYYPNGAVKTKKVLDAFKKRGIVS